METIVAEFATFLDRHGRFFRTRGRDNAAVACRYLRGLAQAQDCTFESMAAVVEDGCAQQFQHFISNSPWDHEPVLAQISRDADALLGGKPTSALIIDESSFPKQGDRSVGVARQWTGRLGKVDNCQVAVFGVLTDGERHTPIDMRLYLPNRWIEDPARCERAGVPEEARTKTSKSRHALDIVRRARERGVRFSHVGVDAGYGKEPAFLRVRTGLRPTLRDETGDGCWANRISFGGLRQEVGFSLMSGNSVASWTRDALMTLTCANGRRRPGACLSAFVFFRRPCRRLLSGRRSWMSSTNA